MDTGKDFRIRIVEDAVKRIEEIFHLRKFKFQFKHYKESQTLVEKGKKSLQSIKYCYLEPDEIINMPEFISFGEICQKIEEFVVEQIKDAKYQPKLPKDVMLIKELNYIFRVFEGFSRRLNNPPDAAFALDTFAVQISRVEKHPEMNKLYICRTTDGKKIWQIITNIVDVKNNEIYPAVHLPPTIFGSEVSEAMFVSDQPITENPGTLIKPTGSILNSINGQVFGLLKN